MLAKTPRQWVRFIADNARQAHVAFAVLALLAGGFFALKVPIGYNPDESVHMFRAYHVGSGHAVTRNVGSETNSGVAINLYGGTVPYSLITLEQYTSAGIRHAALCTGLQCHEPTTVEQQTAAELAAAPIMSRESYDIHFWGAGYYFFLAYLPSALGIDLGRLLDVSVGHLVLMARLFSVLFYVALVCWALYLLRASRAKWLILSVALLPAALTQAASVGTDMFLNASALLLSALLIRGFEQKHLSPSLTALTLALAVLLPLCKSPYALLALPVLLLPIFPSGRAGWAWRAGVLAIIALPTIAWGLFTADMAHTQSILTHAGDGLPNFAQQEHYILTHPLQYTATLVGSFFREDWLGGLALLTQQNVMLPLPLVLASLSSVGLAALFAAKPARTPARRYHTLVSVTYLGAGLLCLAAIGTAMYVSYNAVGYTRLEGVQGRYLIPALPLLALGLARLLPLRIDVAGRAAFARDLFLGGLILTTAGTVAWYCLSVFVWA